jgi:hypothetical protein
VVSARTIFSRWGAAQYTSISRIQGCSLDVAHTDDPRGDDGRPFRLLIMSLRWEYRLVAGLQRVRLG